jgi:hypothetical protein
VEIVVFTPIGAAPSINALKQTIAWKSNGRFHLVPSGFAPLQNNSTVGLCYRHELSPGKKVKKVIVELIYCYDAKIEQVRLLYGLPLVPLSFLVLRKLEKWVEATKRRQILDMDVRQLLGMLEMHRPDDVPFSSELHKSSRRRVQAFSSVLPECAKTWRKLGFEPLVDASRTSAAILSPPLSGDLSAVSSQETEQFMIENPSRIQMVFLAGLTTVGIIHKLGFSCAVYGSLACFLYGNVREPNVCVFSSLNVLLAD